MKVPTKYERLLEEALSGKNPDAAIRSKCLDCSCWSQAEVTRCVIPRCPLYPYRLGYEKTASLKKSLQTDQQNQGSQEASAAIACPDVSQDAPDQTTASTLTEPNENGL
jgi:hypothetical protein